MQPNLTDKLGFAGRPSYFGARVARVEDDRLLTGGARFVADITALRRHCLSGAAEVVDLPVIDEQYGATAREAEGLAVKAMGEWIDRNLSVLEKRPAVSDVSDSR